VAAEGKQVEREGATANQEAIWGDKKSFVGDEGGWVDKKKSFVGEEE